MFRVSVLLTGMLVVLLTVTVLRTETARLENEIARLETEAIDLWQAARVKELELARVRNPMIMRARVAESRLGGPASAGGEDRKPASGRRP